ncbi:Cytoplasmic GTPase/eEF2-like protein (ribosomal biogenesis) [Allomyces javanicus]|nr:Cytoplasmic GTPase/eEF2-like protein (ribosomal biogenesis) [Allomyces javanicus]
MPITAAQVQVLQEHQENIRNICILAHVDHGKTTLSDSLIATNGIISSKLSGQVRYLDSRKDEQERGITMKASAIALSFKAMGADNTPTEYLVNLIDSPGHVDFTSEVSTASRLCDGALVLVDAVEGVCTQTITVLHQAWVERIKPILVVNKMDRLATELKMTPLEAYQHVAKIIQHANAVMGTFFQSELAERDAVAHERRKTDEEGLVDGVARMAVGENGHGQKDGGEHDEQQEDEDDDEGIYFSPQAGNVVFASAIHGWAFRIQYFARLYAAKLKIKEEQLLKFLWGEYYLDPKTKRVLLPKQLKGRDLKPLAVQFIFDNVWAIYEACGLAVTSDVTDEINVEKVEKVANALKLKLHPRDLRKGKSLAGQLALASSLLGQWLPLSSAILMAAIQQTPSPVTGQHTRAARVFPLLTAFPALQADVIACRATDATATVGFLSKMVPVPAASMPQYRPKQVTAEELRARKRAVEADLAELSMRTLTADEVSAEIARRAREDSDLHESAPEGDIMVGMARLYAGRLRRGDQVYVFGPKYDPRVSTTAHVAQVTVEHLYVLMGRDVEEVDEVVAGNIFGIAGMDLETHVLKSATISTTLQCPSLAALNTHAVPIVRVAVEPANPADLPKLVEGLKLLNQSDPAVDVVVQPTGEHVILTAGELHLERCLVDLRERFAKCRIHVSPPIVPFRESIVDAPPQPQYIDAESTLPPGTVELSTPNKLCTVRVRSLPLPKEVTDFLVAEADAVQRLVEGMGDDPTTTQPLVTDFLARLQAIFDKEAPNEPHWRNVSQRLWALGPRRTGPNLLLNDISGYDRAPWLTAVGTTVAEYENAVLTGFQLATSAGPLCSEPMHGVAFSVERVTWPTASTDEETVGTDVVSATQGQAMTTVRDACRAAFLQRSPRLLLATYKCVIQCLSESLGMVYGAVARRRGRIIAEDMREGTPYFVVEATIPVIESFGFADDIRKRTSGGASPQLVFAGWEVLDMDPFWVPTTEEELEDFGAVADRENVAKKYVDAVRKRKGMLVEEKIVEHAEKQRTLMRK